VGAHRGKPLWQLVCDLSPEQFVASVDFRYLTDVLDRRGARHAARSPGAHRASQSSRDGYPAYLTSAGWLGYDEATVRTCAGRRSPTAGVASRRRSASTWRAMSAGVR
jgi:L-fuconate dehydratase